MSAFAVGSSVRREEPPLSLLKGKTPYKKEEGWDYYRLALNSDRFMAVANRELSGSSWVLASASYAGGECWTLYTDEVWSIEFNEDPRDELMIRVYKAPPRWLAWIYEKLGIQV